MSKHNSRRDSQIEALHAALLALLEAGAVGAPPTGTTWVYSSQTAEGAWIFAYKTQEDPPGEGWKKISNTLIEQVSGGEGFVRVGP